MRRWSSGLEAHRLGLGVRGELPSRPGKTYVLHGEQSLPALTRILQKEATADDLLVAQALAERNAHLDEFVKGALAAGAQYASQGGARRLAGTGLAGAAGGATLAYLMLPEADEQTLVEV